MVLSQQWHLLKQMKKDGVTARHCSALPETEKTPKPLRLPASRCLRDAKAISSKRKNNRKQTSFFANGG